MSKSTEKGAMTAVNLDTDSGEWVESSEQRQAMANTCLDWLRRNSIATGVVLRFVRDNRIYLESGYSSFNEYLIGGLSISRSGAYDYMRLAETFLPHVRPRMIAGVQQLDRSTDDEREDAGVQQLDMSAGIEFVDSAGKSDSVELLIKSLSEISRGNLLAIQQLGQKAADELITTGSVTLPDGTKISQEDLQSLTTRAANELIQQHTKERSAWRDRNQQLESKATKAQSEADGAMADLTALRQQMADLQKEHERLRAQLPEGKQTITDVRRALSLAYDLLCDASSALKDIPDLASYDDDGLYETARLIQVMINNLSNSASTLDTGDGLMVGVADFDFDKAASVLGGTHSVGVGGDGQ